ncbi:regulatory protein, tetR family [Brevibacterium sandarakinum]|uniref:Regulatory protein, tetR family n=1 Tax=Brevibacterium sandarakinum TaxID=629680 RepID=A0A1H1TNU0_BRESA|nr:TetR/AcrR family transcriptional regulator [Brevibacterium sandarakinum]SDS61804.1 regulatory protein, tetR family [Brevibacterium sandarakinum]
MTQRKVGRPARLDRSNIARAGIAVADRADLAQVTMRAVAAEIGSAPAALYRHVGDRGELVALMIDEVLAEKDIVRASGTWQADLAVFAAGLFELYRAHPWLSTGVLPQTMGPRIGEVTNEAIELLNSHPAPVGRRYAAIAVLLELVSGYARSADQVGVSAAKVVEMTGAAAAPHSPRTGADEDYAIAVIIAAVGGVLDAGSL